MTKRPDFLAANGFFLACTGAKHWHGKGKFVLNKLVLNLWHRSKPQMAVLSRCLTATAIVDESKVAYDQDCKTPSRVHLDVSIYPKDHDTEKSSESRIVRR